jgi:hypothetical protein
MSRGELGDVSELLGRAIGLVDSFESSGERVPVGERPGFLVRQRENNPQPILERIASARRMTFVIGAGASMEAGLPSWGGLVRSLLESAAPKSLGESDRAAWLDAAAESGLLGMAAIARALASNDRQFVKRVNSQLFRGKSPDDFEPGPLAREIAAWKKAYPEIQLATFNYDPLLERALSDAGVAVESRENNEPEPDGVAFVRHLHGFLTGRAADAVVLTERDYATWRDGGWQDVFMSNALGGVCVFLGLSFTDQNLLRWIYGASGNQHVAVLARQSAPRLSHKVRRELEVANRARLARANVTAYWADFYAEVAQLMYEARRRKEGGPRKPLERYPVRAQKRAEKGRSRCVPVRGLEQRQREVRAILSGSLSGIRAALESVNVEVSDAVLGLGLWGLDYGQREVTLWASSDRIHADRSTLTGVPLAWDSKWVAVEAITQGSVVEWDPDTYASRWRSVRGIPLLWTGSRHLERIIVGAVTLTTTTPSGKSIFDKAEALAPGIRRTIDVELHDELVRLWD